MTANTDNQREIFSVSRLNRQVRQLLETQFSIIWVEGEISNFSCPASGHWYFTLKDEQAQVRCAMFRGKNTRVGFQPEHGKQVLIRCRVGLYENRGDFQLIAENMEEAGHGALQRKFELLKKQLSDEGLFDPQQKQELPWLPARIGVITSPTGAAIQDILHVLKRRFPAIPVTVFPCAVQGDAATKQIVRAIEQANSQTENRCEVLIIGRGGGSLEDLWAFNEEPVARAIYSSSLPIISAVGHEVDFTIADFVADVRAPTPSAAAEMVSPDAKELLGSFVAYEQLLQQTLVRSINNHQQQLDHLGQRLRHPGERIQQQWQQISSLEARLSQSIYWRLQQQRSYLSQLTSHLNRHHPQSLLMRLHTETHTLQQRLLRAVKQHLQRKHSHWETTAQLLNAVSPLQTLERGYAIVSDSKKQLISKVASVRRGDKITARVNDGSLVCKIEDIISE